MEMWQSLHKGFGVRHEFLLSVAFYSSLSSLISINTSCIVAFNLPPSTSVLLLKGALSKGFLSIILLLFMKWS